MATPAWKNNLRPASFRGVKFFVESSEVEIGRRGVTHEFIQRDKPFGEDTGRLARKFPVDAYVLGGDYMDARDKLIEALETAGPGELIHPYFGRQVVDCFGGVKVRESTREGGMAVFSIPFVEHGEELFPTATVDNSYKVGLASDAVMAAAKKDFASKFSVAGLPGFVFNDATDRLNTAASYLSKVSGSISGRSDAIAEFALSVRRLKSNAIDLINKPSSLADELASNLTLLAQAATAPREVFDALKKAMGYGDDEPAIPTPTATRAAQAQNAAAMNDFIKTMAVTQGAVAATSIEYESTDDAFKYRKTILDASEVLMETATDEVYQALQDLRATLVKAVPPPGEDLATVGEVVNQVTLPSLVIAYDLYESVDLEADLIARNRISHPGFVPGGQTLEVLEIEQT